jgi:hypothetical protein
VTPSVSPLTSIRSGVWRRGRACLTEIGRNWLEYGSSSRGFIFGVDGEA